jgi:hypothetical protein
MTMTYSPGRSSPQLRAAMVDSIVMRALGYVPNGKNGTPAIANEQRSREFANMGLPEMGAELAGVPIRTACHAFASMMS